jgi:catechol 2,3-dioxygenase-like lactoylglutathione lyase family enzyme
MAITALERPKIRCLSRFGLTTANAAQLASFYERAFGCRRLASERRSGFEFESLMAVGGGAASVTLGLGNELIELLQFDQAGRPYPSGCSSLDLVFQHFAIVVTDIKKAFQRLSTLAGWTAITSAGPQHLPARSGGVTAFKFRDPDGHPLELLAFDTRNVPPRWRAAAGADLCLGIDHSAISVSNSARAIQFYEELGFKVAAHSVNTGIEQERLDAVREPEVEITALRPIQPSPHVELLCYRGVRRHHGDVLQSNDVAATRLVFEARPADHSGAETLAQHAALQDPDGHHLLIVAPQTRSTACPDRLRRQLK